MANLTAEDKANLVKLRMFAGPELAEFTEKMMAMKGQNPALDRAGDAFAAQAGAWKNLGNLKGLNTQFKNNPQLAGKMEQLLKTNPEAFEKNVGRMFADPGQTMTIVEEQLEKPVAAPSTVPSPMEAAASSAAPVPAQQRPGVRLESKPADTGARTDKVDPAVISSSVPSGAAAIPATTSKLEAISAVPGFSGLMERIDNNPHLSDLKGMMAGNGGKDESLIDALHEKTKSDPEFFNKVNKVIDESPPGILSSMASMAAHNGPAGLMAFDTYASLRTGPMGQIMGSFMDSGLGMSLMQSILPAISNIMRLVTGAFDKVKGYVGNGLQGASHIMAQENRPGMTMRALDAVMKNPPLTISMVDPHGGGVTETTMDGLKKQQDEIRRRGPQQGAPQLASNSMEPALQGPSG